MEIIRGDGKLLKNIDLAPGNVYQEVLQNIAVILAMVQKSAPMLRDMGIPGDLYGRPLPIVESLLVGHIYDQIEQYEPRAIIGGVSFERDDLKGVLIPIIELEGIKEDGE